MNPPMNHRNGLLDEFGSLSQIVRLLLAQVKLVNLKHALQLDNGLFVT